MTSLSELESLGIRAAGSANGKEEHNVPKQVTLSNGIVLRVKPMPPMLLASVANSIPEPPVPMTYLDDKGREEPNPNHPDYVRAMQERMMALGLATNNLIIYACTEVIEIPDGVWRPIDDDWIVLTDMAGVTFDREDKAQRYIAWVRCYAMATQEDMNKILSLPIMLAGTSEEEVSEAMDSFRGGEGRDSDTGISDEVRSQDGNNLPQPNRRARRANRGT